MVDAYMYWLLSPLPTMARRRVPAASLGWTFPSYEHNRKARHHLGTWSSRMARQYRRSHQCRRLLPCIHNSTRQQDSSFLEQQTILQSNKPFFAVTSGRNVSGLYNPCSLETRNTVSTETEKCFPCSGDVSMWGPGMRLWPGLIVVFIYSASRYTTVNRHNCALSRLGGDMKHRSASYSDGASYKCRQW